ncbi:HNH endonuclease family protein [Microbacterium sp. B2969]|uniref:HNH endonuclease family protein n=1 Tax=Microbacterium alkaliflavum TaxID=3248839 RepID=A0ABW7QIX7_9MICO
MRKKSIAFVILGVAALFIGFRMVAPTLTTIVGPLAAPKPASTTTPAEVQPAGPVTADAAQAITELDHVTVAPPQQTPYDRRQFGQAWADVDRNGCDTRNDVLRRDLVDTTLKPGTHDCVVLSGVLHDPYTGKTIDFTRGQGTSELVQIDHVVPLAWAWRQGAADWTEAKRQQLANDPLNLLAVDGPTNTAKSDQGPALWMPPSSSYRCSYAERFVQVLNTYDLTIPAEDHTALQRELTSCTGGK